MRCLMLSEVREGEPDVEPTQGSILTTTSSLASGNSSSSSTGTNKPTASRSSFRTLGRLSRRRELDGGCEAECWNEVRCVLQVRIGIYASEISMAGP